LTFSACMRGADHPCRRGRVHANGPPGRARPGEGLSDKLLRGVPVTDADQDRAKAVIPLNGPPVLLFSG
jgi:hypothetical protein